MDGDTNIENMVRLSAKSEPRLFRYRVKPEKSALVDSWMQELREREEECEVTLERERTVCGAVFRSRSNGEEFIYWFVWQAEGGASPLDSPHDVDQAHLKYWQECVDPCDESCGEVPLENFWSLLAKV